MAVAKANAGGVVDSAMITVASIFVMQIGSRFLFQDLTPAQQQFLKLPMVQAVVLTSMFFVATRNVWASLAMVSTYWILTQVLLNENNAFHVYSVHWLERSLQSPQREAMDDRVKAYHANVARLRDLVKQELA